MEPPDKEAIRSSLKTFIEDPKRGAYQLIEHLEPKLRKYIMTRLSTVNATGWFRAFVEPNLDGRDIATIQSNFNRETGKPVQELYKEQNPFCYANIRHLQKTIVSPTNWQQFFQNDLKDVNEFNSNMNIIVRVRHPTMHIRETTFEAVVLPVIWILERIR